MKLSQLKIDPEFQSKIPPLQFEEEQQLKQNNIAEGRLLNPIITWNGYILDGHTRYRILKKHGFIKFEAEEIQLANKYEALAWICKNQLGRRNLSPERKKFLLEQIFTIDKSRIERFMGYASKAEMLRIDMALLVSLALNVLSENRSE
ncbi:type II toxin-antitoxin system PemK/MazF family toxin [Faecalibacterium prausnitzii]|uniref:type II toxin-antitoxin system PemK/MazF family toxin n=1 Tax=Faecalibacterium prausnitzii TaxID=853 RepID=UPI001CBA8B24|nr:type II toxin-antitoxin system PemK/MazF family toxin [Faecalibacterium prausnitzii]